eukprot:CAMPEP_0172163000 /NCGR_PEP_ID=MMETSP1050-20130122/7020_1 /TAXON_ID=233186 /ORGANISM="Cryptomonas curvata, Strain CCAP979/52" /LENGTH=131 /DNA_ID=CAMNT_0012833125 /DNA_START=999 /DNA_END=1394 /DNA_ORIENTATION=+
MSHLEPLKFWRGQDIQPTAKVFNYNQEDPYKRNVRVYVYAETWDPVESIEEEDTRRKTFITKARDLHDFPLSEEWPVELLKMDRVGQALKERSRDISATSASIICYGWMKGMLAGYDIPADVARGLTEDDD